MAVCLALRLANHCTPTASFQPGYCKFWATACGLQQHTRYHAEYEINTRENLGRIQNFRWAMDILHHGPPSYKITKLYISSRTWGVDKVTTGTRCSRVAWRRRSTARQRSFDSSTRADRELDSARQGAAVHTAWRSGRTCVLENMLWLITNYLTCRMITNFIFSCF